MSASKVKSQKIPPNVVTMNSEVKIHVVNTGNEMILDLVYPDHANVSVYKVSIFSSLGAAIFSTQIGDEVDYSRVYNI